MAVPHPLPEELARLIADRFRVLAEPMRIRLLDALRDGEETVGALALRLDASQQNVSKHLGVLVAAGLVARERRGNHAVCRIADMSVFDLCELVCGGMSRQVAEVQSLLSSPEASA